MNKGLTIESLMEESHKTAVEKGWWDDPNRNIGEVLALMHSEVSEALEEWRNGHALTEIYYNLGSAKPEGFPIEMADILIRIFDNCKKFEIPLVQALILKGAFNKTRPYRHGNKKA